LRSVLPSLRRYLAGLAGSADGDDLLQDVMVIIIRKLGSLQDPQVFRPWTFRMRAAKRSDISRSVARGWRSTKMIFILTTWRPPRFRPSGEELRELLAIAEISPASRAVLMLHFQEDLPIAEVAAILDIPLGTAKSRLAYGLASIRKHMKRNGGSHG
jgi:RNA polymerase sigma-70 factor (ECF subfamily)